MTGSLRDIARALGGEARSLAITLNPPAPQGFAAVHGKPDDCRKLGRAQRPR